jgi:hypothetical protein
MIDAVTVVQVVVLVCTKSNLFNLTKLIEKYINIYNVKQSCCQHILHGVSHEPNSIVYMFIHFFYKFD